MRRCWCSGACGGVWDVDLTQLLASETKGLVVRKDSAI